MLTTPLPPDELMIIVSAHAERDHWGNSRRAAVADVIIPILQEAGVDAISLKSILDFGCGCGRILAGWERLIGDATLKGVDINPALVRFCQANIPFAQVSLCEFAPPLAFPAGSFDFVYAASVFTHMTRDSLGAWAAEMHRIIAPQGILMVSFHGAYYHSALDENLRSALHRDGCVVQIHKPARDTFEGSNDYATFMTGDFARSLFGGFDLLTLRDAIARGPTHFAAHQDIAIFRRC